MAQGQKLKGRLIDKDHYPVKNAKVTVKGTNLSTTSDKDGNFFIEDVPLYLDSIQVENGRKDITVNTPMKISMGRLVIDKRFSWFVKAGVGVSRFLGADQTKEITSFHVGGGNAKAQTLDRLGGRAAGEQQRGQHTTGQQCRDPFAFHTFIHPFFRCRKPGSFLLSQGWKLAQQ